MSRATAKSLKDNLLAFREQLIGLRRWSNPLASPHAPPAMRTEIGSYLAKFQSWSQMAWCYLAWLDELGGNPALPDDFTCPGPVAPDVPPPPPPPPPGGQGGGTPGGGGGTVNQPPVADAGGPYYGVINQPIQVDGLGTADPDDPLSSLDFRWEWGDGEVSQGLGNYNPTHRYEAAGDYTIGLRVTDPRGLWSEDTTSASISSDIPEQPIADPDGPYTTTVNVSFTADGTRSTWDGRWLLSEIYWQWVWGDGTSSEGYGVNRPGKIYTTTGTKTISLTITDPLGRADTASTTCEVTPAQNFPPVAAFSGPASLIVGQVGTWDASATYDPPSATCQHTNAQMTFLWNWGDGTTNTGITRTKSYATAGTYRVLLTVTEPAPCNLVGTAFHDVIVSAAPPGNEAPTAILTGPQQVNANQSYTWDASASHDNGQNPTPPESMLYTYDWGDGTTATSGIGRRTATHTYTQNNIQRVITLTVNDQHPTNPLTATAVLAVIVGTITSYPCPTCGQTQGRVGVGAWTGWCNRFGTTDNLEITGPAPDYAMGLGDRGEGQRSKVNTCTEQKGRIPESAGGNWVFCQMDLKFDPGWIDPYAAGLGPTPNCGGGQHFLKIGSSPKRCSLGCPNCSSCPDEPNSIRFDFSPFYLPVPPSWGCTNNVNPGFRDGFKQFSLYAAKNGSMIATGVVTLGSPVTNIYNNPGIWVRTRFEAKYEPSIGRCSAIIKYNYGQANEIVRSGSGTQEVWKNINYKIGDDIGFGNVTRQRNHGYAWIRNFSCGRLD